MDIAPAPNSKATLRPKLGDDALVAAICGAGRGDDGWVPLLRAVPSTTVWPRHRPQRHQQVGPRRRHRGAWRTTNRGATSIQCRGRPALEVRAAKRRDRGSGIGEVVNVITVTNQSRAVDHGAGGLQCRAAGTVGAYVQKINCSASRTDHGAGREARDCRWCSMSIRLSSRP